MPWAQWKYQGTFKSLVSQLSKDCMISKPITNELTGGIMYFSTNKYSFKSNAKFSNHLSVMTKSIAISTLIIASLTGCASSGPKAEEAKEPDIYVSVCGNVNEFVGIYLDFDLATTVQKAQEIAAEFRSMSAEDPEAEYYASIMDGFVNTGGTGAENPSGWGELVKFCDSRR